MGVVGAETSAPNASAGGTRGDAGRVELILAQIEQLPTLSAVATRILQAAASPETGAADIVALVETDQALTAKIISLVRRADLGAGREVNTLTQAVVLLGVTVVRNAVLSVQIYETFASHEAAGDSALDRTEFWKHSLAVACAAQSIARRLGREVGADEAFVCGLLHDLGKVALDACLPKSYARIVRETEARQACICDVERQVLGLDHTLAGKRLGRHWKLPATIVECIWLHHLPPQNLPASVASARLIQIVHLADEVIRQQRIGYSGYHRREDVADLASQLGLGDEALPAVIAEVGPRMEEYSALFGLADLTTADLYAQAMADANQELGRLNTTLAVANRRLELRSRCFDALRRFHETLTPEDRLADVCRAAAECILEAMQAEGPAVGFALTATPTLCAYGTTFSGADRAGLLTLDRPPEPLPTLAPGRLHPLPEAVRPLVEHFGRRFGGGPIWMLPVSYGSKAAGGVFLVASNDAVEQWAGFTDELEALASAFGLALAIAATRTQAEQRSEELADVNRRLHTAQAELLQAKSLGMIANLAAGAAHELNNPLAVISGRAQMVADAVDDPDQQQALRTITEQAHRASAMVSELLAFAKPDPPQLQTLSLGPWLDRLRQHWLATSSLGPDQLSVRLDDPGLTVRADPDQLTQVFEALIANAIEATTPENARLQINSASAASDDTIVLSVLDNGVGMAPDVLEHALDPFFSHRPAGRGRGLGLSRAYSLLLSNGGRLWIDSTPGIGTAVHLELPSARPG
ncbi:MAG: HDOD domain-containing protein [Planctomycetes bacterium]|nr:HDOD domain-containing protein [Planctomycetota bacterium]